MGRLKHQHADTHAILPDLVARLYPIKSVPTQWDSTSAQRSGQSWALQNPEVAGDTTWVLKLEMCKDSMEAQPI